MRLTETILFYLLLGAAVAVAVFVHGKGPTSAERFGRVATAFFFWPLYLPLLLAPSRSRELRTGEAPAEPADAMARAISQVERELAAALSSLDGWAEDVLARESGRIEELQRAWKSQAARIRDMDGLLAQEEEISTGCGSEPIAGHDRVRHCQEARRENIERLREVRRRAHDELLGTIAWVRELVSMIQLAKFTGAPVSRAEELVAQIAASVEGLSEVSAWQGD